MPILSGAIRRGRACLRSLASLAKPLGSSRSIPDTFDTLDVRVLGPQFRAIVAGGREDDTVGQRQLQLDTKRRRARGNLRSQPHDSSLLHSRHRLKCCTLVTLLEHPLEHFEETYRGDHKVLDVFDRFRKEGGVRIIGKILQLGAGIDDIHTRSAARSTLVSSPFREPLSSRIGRTGISTLRSLQAIAWIFWPGRRQS